MLPEGEYLYKDLSSDFVDVDKLLNEISQEDVSGYLSFESEEGDESGFAELTRGMVGRMKIIRNGDESVDDSDGGDALKEVLKGGSYTVQVVECDDSGEGDSQHKARKRGNKVRHIYRQHRPTTVPLHERDRPEERLSYHNPVGGSRRRRDYGGRNPRRGEDEHTTEIFVGDEALKEALGLIEDGEVTVDIYDMSEEDVKEKEESEEAIGERMQGELEGISDEFEDKADELLDDMGLDFMKEGDEEGGEIDVGGDDLDLGGEEEVFGEVESEDS